MKKGFLNVILGGQHGSEGKGKMVAYIARKWNPDMAIANHGSNAGHSFYIDGRKFIAFHLPASAACPRTELCIGPSAIISLPMFLQELKDFAPLHVEDRLHIHPLAVMITEECQKWEKENLTRISSTTKGCGYALAMKIMRHPSVMLAVDVPELKPFIADTTEMVRKALHQDKVVIAESAQGFDLSINQGRMYPYVTSRAVDVAQTLSDCGVSPRLLGDVYGCIRCHPIRVGNVMQDAKMIGFSGPKYDDQDELTWDQITQESGSATPILELTTVTGKVRRVFSWSDIQMQKFVDVCHPDFLCLNFVNYLDAKIQDTDSLAILAKCDKVNSFVTRITTKFKTPIAYFGTGAGEAAMVDTMEDEVLT